MYQYADSVGRYAFTQSERTDQCLFRSLSLFRRLSAQVTETDSRFDSDPRKNVECTHTYSFASTQHTHTHIAKSEHSGLRRTLDFNSVYKNQTLFFASSSTQHFICTTLEAAELRCVAARSLRFSRLSYQFDSLCAFAMYACVLVRACECLCAVRTIKSRLQNGFARSGRENRVEIVCALK